MSLNIVHPDKLQFVKELFPAYPACLFLRIMQPYPKY